MSQITLSTNASGTAIFTVAAPGTSTNRTLTLPDQTSTLATTADVAASQSMILLGTLTMTSGTSQTLSGLNLTSYKQLWVVYDGIVLSASTAVKFGTGNITNSPFPSSFSAMSWTDLIAGMTSSNTNAASGGTFSSSGYTTATTSVSVSISTGTFTAGTVYIYGAK